ncbi:hypothetical protein ACS0TY_010848 [Phlomoides rotata]
MATNIYICDVCHKGFQRDQNLQLHRRGHNLPWKLKQRPNTQSKKRVYVCPDPNCVHHNPRRALGDLTGIKKHYCRKHGEKKWKCDKCSKRYAVQSDWKAHAKICGTREYHCDCGTIFLRKDSFVTHRAFCDALSEENYKGNQNQAKELFSSSVTYTNTDGVEHLSMNTPNPLSGMMMIPKKFDPFYSARALSSNCKTNIGFAYTSATALLQKAAEIGSKSSDDSISHILFRGFTGYYTGTRNASHETIQEGSHGMHVGNMEASDIHQIELYDHSDFMHSGKNKTGLNEMGESDEKMTLDFLGVEPPSGDQSGYSKKRKYGDDSNELGSMRDSLQDQHCEWC